jgi:large subunit ribosomal protein L21
MSYAIIKTGGLQHRVTVGEKLNIGNIEAAEGDSVSFDQVLAAGEGESVRVGAPFIQGATVAAKVLGQIKGEKVVAFKFRRRKGYHRTVGHRQRLTRVEITSINA